MQQKPIQLMYYQAMIVSVCHSFTRAITSAFAIMIAQRSLCCRLSDQRLKSLEHFPRYHLVQNGRLGRQLITPKHHYVWELLGCVDSRGALKRK